jgi:hypothetical protein
VPCSCASVARTCQALASTKNLTQHIMYLDLKELPSVLNSSLLLKYLILNFKNNM